MEKEDMALFFQKGESNLLSKMFSAFPKWAVDSQSQHNEKTQLKVGLIKVKPIKTAYFNTGI